MKIREKKIIQIVEKKEKKNLLKVCENGWDFMNKRKAYLVCLMRNRDRRLCLKATLVTGTTRE